MEPAETYEEAAIREVFEEVGIKVKNLKLFGLYSGEERLIHYPNEDVVYSLSVIFITDEYEGDISSADGEALEHRFFDRNNIPTDLFAPDDRPIVDWVNGVVGVVVR